MRSTCGRGDVRLVELVWESYGLDVHFMSRRGFLVIALLLCLVDSGVAAPRTQRPGVLRVGTYFVNPPFEYIWHGRRVGFEVDLMNEIARRLGMRAEFVDTQWEVIIQQMQDNRYDCIVGGITITPARCKTLNYSIPYMTTTLSLVVNVRKTPRIRSLNDMKDAIVGVQAATTDYDVAMKMQRHGQIKEVRVYSFDRIANAMTDLAGGQITAVMKVFPVAARMAHQTPGLRIVAQVPHDPQPLGIGFNKDNPGLLAAVNQALHAMLADGTCARLARRWAVP